MWMRTLLPPELQCLAEAELIYQQQAGRHVAFYLNIFKFKTRFAYVHK